VEDEFVLVNPFPGWLAEVAADVIVVKPDDINAEARSNFWSFSLSPEQVGCVSPNDVEEFATGVAIGRRAWLVDRASAPMVLYWWHDKQAGQLRFSLVSASHGRLPFGCQISPAASFHEIAASWLKSPHLHGIMWGELRALGPDEPPVDPSPTVLPVWSLLLP
jgi:hypothetical protein